MTGAPLALCVALAGGAGAVARYLIDLVVNRYTRRGIPKGTIAVNVIGSFIIGLTAGAIAHHHLAGLAELVVGTGFCGGLTTASSAAFEVARNIERGALRDAGVIVTVGVGCSCLAASVGLGLMLL